MIDSETTETLATIVSDDSSEEEDSVTKVHKVTFRTKQKKILNTPTGASTNPKKHNSNKNFILL